MSLINVSGLKLRVVITLLLATFCVQAAQGSFCSEITMTSAAEVADSAKMPCHGEDDASSEEQCCLACVSMAVVTYVPLIPSESVASNVAAAIQFDLATRLELLYRPPSNYLS